MRAFRDMGRGNRGLSLPWNVMGGSAVEAVVRSLPKQPGSLARA